MKWKSVKVDSECGPAGFGSLLANNENNSIEFLISDVTKLCLLKARNFAKVLTKKHDNYKQLTRELVIIIMRVKS